MRQHICKRAVNLLFCLLALAGCAGGGTMIIPSSEQIDSAGNIVTRTASTVGDTSSYRTHEKYMAWKTAYREYGKAYGVSGFTMSYQEVLLKEGTRMFLPLISFKQPPQFVPPTDLKDHPVWRSIDNVVNKVTPYAFGAWAVNSIVGGYESLSDKVSGRNEYVTLNGSGDLNYESNHSEIVVRHENSDISVNDVNSNKLAADIE